MQNFNSSLITIIVAFAISATYSLGNNRFVEPDIPFDAPAFDEINDEAIKKGVIQADNLAFDIPKMNSHPAVIEFDTDVNDIKRVTSHYYVSLCYWGLKRLGFAGSESTYEDESIAEELAEVGESFAFEPPKAGGPIFNLVYQIPGYLDPQEPYEMYRIFEAVKQMVESGTIRQLKSEFPDRTAEWEKWYIESGIEAFLEPLQKDKDKVFWLIDRFAGYLEQLWSQYEAEYSDWYEEFDFDRWNSKLPVEKVINAWEQEMNISYPYEEFSLVVCPESPTRASSLGPEKVVFGARHGLKQTKKSLVHEVGVRMVCFYRLAEHPKTARIVADDHLGITKLLEAEACYRKPQVFDELGMEYQADEDGFIASMGLEKLIRMRSGICDEDSIFEIFAKWYDRAKQEGLI